MSDITKAAEPTPEALALAIVLFDRHNSHKAPYTNEADALLIDAHTAALRARIADCDAEHPLEPWASEMTAKLKAAEERIVELSVELARKAVAPMIEKELEVEKFPPGFFEQRYGAAATKGMTQDETFRWLVERSNRLDGAEARTKELEAERDTQRARADRMELDMHKAERQCDFAGQILTEAMPRPVGRQLIDRDIIALARQAVDERAERAAVFEQMREQLRAIAEAALESVAILNADALERADLREKLKAAEERIASWPAMYEQQNERNKERAEVAEAERDAAIAARDMYAAYCGDELLRSDYRTAGEMRVALKHAEERIACCHRILQDIHAQVEMPDGRNDLAVRISDELSGAFPHACSACDARVDAAVQAERERWAVQLETEARSWFAGLVLRNRRENR